MDNLGIFKYFNIGDSKHLVESPNQVEHKMEINKKHEYITEEECHKIVYDMIDNNNGSEITITFVERLRVMYSDIELAKRLRKYIGCITEKYAVNIVLFPEYGDNNNLHYHGVITNRTTRGCKTKYSKILRELKASCGRTTLRSIRNTEKYKKYLFKERLDYEFKDYKRLVILMVHV